ncbi:MAG: DUF4294 domain-containing protein [Paramuribaculum sp.]|nr:DUF4294 domain-containing protein [Paramuribaculum sp.]
MKLIKIILAIILTIPSVTTVKAAVAEIPSRADIEDIDEDPDLPSPRLTGYQGYYIDNINGEDVKVYVLREVTVFPPLVFKNKKEEEFYWKTVRDVKKTLPYAKLICSTLLETYEYIETFPTQKEREDYLKQMEGELFKQYKPAMRKFTKSQAKVLVKLIKRETDQSSYNIIKAFLGSFRAGFWQTFGRLFGVNLKGDYKPDTDRNDGLIERIAVGVELGRL